MFGLGMMEIGLIIVIAVMLFPPTELPKLVRSIAKIYGQVRRTAEDFRSTVLEDEDLRQPLDEIKGAYNDARWEVRDAERKARQQLAKAQMDMRLATARRLQAEREAEAKAVEAGAEATPATATTGPVSTAPPTTGTATAGTPATARPTPPRPAPVGPVRIASAADGNEDDDDAADEHGPIAAVDPRLLTAHAGKAAPAAPPQTKPDDGEQPREGVA